MMSDESSNTAEEQRKVPGKPFVKGDPRINRKGRPKSFDKLRELAQQLAHEVAKANGQSLVRDGHAVTQIEALLLDLMHSNPERFIEIAFGKVPTPLDVTLNDWQERAINAIRSGEADYNSVLAEFGKTLTAELFRKAGVSIPEDK